MKVTENREFNGLEVYFDEKPAQNVIDELKNRHFRWHNFKKCWYAKNTPENREFFEKIGNGEKIESSEKIESVQRIKKDFSKWIEEYVQRKNREWPGYYTTKELAGACELKNGFILGRRKDGIQTRFCFHDEGPDYDFYRELKSENEKMRRYFMRENLSDFDFYLDLLRKAKNKESTFPKYVGAYLENETKTAVLTFRNYSDLTGEFEIEKGIAQHEREPNFYPLDDEELDRVLEMVEQTKADFEKRLNTWWKKYGAEKLHTWTYWADA